MPIDIGEVVSDIPDILALIAAGEKAIKDLPQDATDLQCAVAVVKAVVGPLGDLALKIEAQAKS